MADFGWAMLRAVEMMVAYGCAVVLFVGMAHFIGEAVEFLLED